MADSISEAVAGGNELEILYATRKAVAESMDMCENAHDLSSLVGKMTDICARISELEKQQKPKRKSAIAAARAVKKG